MSTAIGYKDFPEILELVMDRWAFLHTESMAFAYFLDPKTKAGEGFIGNDLYDSDFCLKEFIMKNQFAQSVQQIEAELELFVQSMKFMTDRELDYVSQKSALTYWLTVGATKFPILYKVAEIVFNVPTSQAASERAWSIYDFILTKRRNRLTPGKLTKLVQLYMDAGLAEKRLNLIDVMMAIEADQADNSDEPNSP